MRIVFFVIFLSFSSWLEAHKLDNVYSHFNPENERDSTNRLLTKIDTLELRYIIWGCQCPNWITVSDHKDAEINGRLIDRCIYIESENGMFELPNYFDPEKHAIKVIGHFYEKEDYPDDLIDSEEPVGKAKIFHFSEMEIVEMPLQKSIR